MKLNTGKMAFPIEFDNGAVEKIYFNPNDPDLAIKMSVLHETVMKRMEGFPDIETDAEGNPVEKDKVEQFKQITNILCDELNNAFGSDVSSVVFKYCSPFAIVDGEYFMIQFVKAIAPEIKKIVEKSNKNMLKHIEKYAK